MFLWSITYHHETVAISRESIVIQYFRKKRFKLKKRKSKATSMKSGVASSVARSGSDIGDAKDLNEEEVRFLVSQTNKYCLTLNCALGDSNSLKRTFFA